MCAVNERNYFDTPSIQSVAEKLRLSANALHEVLDKFHTHYRKKSETKSGKTRTYHCPFPVLRDIQKRINKYILKAIPLPSSMHGYVAKRSILTNATVHLGKKNIANVDIKSFFPSIHYQRVQRIFRQIGFNEGETLVLTRLTTADCCVPHGFPTSPRLANLVLINADKRLRDLFGQQKINHTFYSDDITISGNKNLRQLLQPIRTIFRQEGFRIHRKESSPQKPYFKRQKITGLLVNNKRLNLPREDIRSLEAIIHNCLVKGPSSQIAEFEAHFGPPKRELSTVQKFKERVLGKLNNVRRVNCDQYKKLKKDFDRIDWN
ncbi:MAG: hypothetical protein A3G91_06405 [Omnitrophica WOR_2 bacterium RIFCSPLOWO2_12_FULL_50_9]|nr:MAG: hypothetical protein A3D87_07665 [Omnitrophica WOR_2 bacterium RIFCSPHIGHO2_02_FULL_50_17]OGX41383.1 MAG: hypothetical protein A3G91_06405 [Omnitrophica WOR_2 bacterium RIFCSPLOWO2_12_FULL_50_9]